MKKYVVLKLIGMAMLTMATLVIISFLEVAVYSHLINAGQEESIYEAHANASAPYISGIFGFIVFFLVARYWKKNGYDNSLKITILFPVMYIVLDIILLTIFGVKWSEFIQIFLLANGAKFLGSCLGYLLTKQR
jgi:hypothetical protein